MVLITWVDAVSEDQWQNLESAKDLHPCQIETLGFLIDKNITRYLVALSVDAENESVSQTLAIPRAWVISVKFLKV